MAVNTVTTESTCWKITCTDSTVYGFTDHDKDLTVSSQAYLSTVGYVPSAYQQSADLAADNMEVMCILDDAGIKEEDLLAGKFDFAEVEIFTVDWTNPAGGIVQRIVTGRMGEVSVADGQGKVSLYGLSQQLQQNVGSQYTVQCRAVYGDAECGIELLPAVWSASDAVVIGDRRRASVYDAREYVVTVAGTTNDTEGEPSFDTGIGNTTVEADGVEWITRDARTKTGTLTSKTDNRVFFDSARYEDDDEFNGGKLTWTSGDNSGYSADVKKYTLSTGEIELYEPMPFDVLGTEDYAITQGCDKSDTTCKARDNFDNYRGFPHLVGLTELLRPPA